MIKKIGRYHLRNMFKIKNGVPHLVEKFSRIFLLFHHKDKTEKNIIKLKKRKKRKKTASTL